MQKIPADLISDIPDSVEASESSCEAAVSPALRVLFFMAGELPEPPDMPPIMSNGTEVYPMPQPWTYAPPLKIGGEKIDTKEVHATCDEWLDHIIKNAEAYNNALDLNDLPTAVKIAEQGVKDSAYVWNIFNALAQSVETAVVYGALQLTEETITAYEAILDPSLREALEEEISDEESE